MAEKVDKSKQPATTKHIPKDAQVIMSIMKDMDIVEYEPRVINQLLEFIYRYVACILEDAKAYANHAKKKSIDLDDVKLALNIQLEQMFTNPPPREVLAEVARAKNNTPLPFIKPHCGIRLPPDRYCLSSSNLKLKTLQKKTATAKSSYGAGTSIKMTPKSGLGVLKRTLSTVTRTQTVTIPKPITKVTQHSQQVKTMIKTEIMSQNTPTEHMVMDDDIGSIGIKRKREDDDM